MSGDEMGVMPLSGSDAGMPEKQLDGANVGSCCQQLDGERVSEAVGMGTDPGNLAQSVDGAGKVLFCRLRAVTEDESIVTRKAGQRFIQMGVERDLNRNSVFQGAEGKVLPADGIPSQPGDVANAKPGIQQNEDQPSGPASNPLKFTGVIGENLIARLEDGADLIVRQRGGCQYLNGWFPQLGCWVRCKVATIHTPGKQLPDGFEFLTPGSGRDGSRLAKVVDISGGDCSCAAPVEVRGKKADGSPVVLEGRFSHAAAFTGSDEGVCSAANEDSTSGEFPALDGVNLAGSVGHDCGVKAAAHPLSPERSIAPDGAETQRIPGTFRRVRAFSDVAAIEPKGHRRA